MALRSSFRALGAKGPNWHRLMKTCLEQLEPLPFEANIGFLYVSGVAGDMVDEFYGCLRAKTGIRHWVGAVASRVMVPGSTGWCEDGVSLAVGALPASAFDLVRDGDLQATSGRGGALLHVDETLMRDLNCPGDEPSPMIVGGAVCGDRGDAQIAGDLVGGGVSGVVFNKAVPFECRQSQGFALIGPVHRVGSSLPGVIKQLDGRPLIDVMTEQVGDILVRRPDRLCDHVAFARSLAPGQYQVWPITEFDPAGGEARLDVRRIPPEMAIVLRDPRSALRDLRTNLDDLAAISSPGNASDRSLVIHIASARRADRLFGPEVDEPKIVTSSFGQRPIIGAAFDREIFAGGAHSLSSATAVIG